MPRKRPVRKRTDHERLELFLRLVRELAQSEAVNRGLQIELHHKWSRADGRLTFELTQPAEADLRALLMTVRKFVSEGSDVHVQSINGIVRRRLARGDNEWTVEALQANLDEVNKSWRRDFESGFIRLQVNGQVVSPESAMNLWLNGKYFHDDPDYAEMLDKLDRDDPHTATLIRWQFLSAVLSTVEYVDWLAGNVRYLLTNNMLQLE